MASRRPFRRYSNSAVRSRLQTGPQNCNNLGTFPPMEMTLLSPGVNPDELVANFSENVITNGVARWTDAADHIVIAMFVTSDFQITFQFDGNVNFPITIPFQDPAIRNAAAGYVLSGTFEAF